MKKFLVFLLVFSVLFLGSCVFSEEKRNTLPLEIEPVNLKPYAKFDFFEIIESSGLVKSRQWKDVFWTHNDSDNAAKIYAVTRNGKLIKDIKILDAFNNDWEDIAADNNGNLYIGDFGNNFNTRRDLSIYTIREPDPHKESSAKIKQKIDFYYPDQESFPPLKLNFDAEALFFAKGKLYLLTKHRSDGYTKLYRFDSLEPAKKNPLTLISSFEIKDRVTAADASPDGNRLAVLTYSSVWLFEIKGNHENYFNGRISWLPIRARQCEAICIDGERLIISNEQRELFDIHIRELVVIKDF